MTGKRALKNLVGCTLCPEKEWEIKADSWVKQTNKQRYSARSLAGKRRKRNKGNL